jgi:hypothetical protein
LTKYGSAKELEELKKAVGDKNPESVDLSKVVDSESIDIEDVDEEKELAVNSAIAVEKEIAADTIGTVFMYTRNHFLPYVEPCVHELVELLSHYYEGIRKSAVTSLFAVIQTFYELSSPAEWIPGKQVVSIGSRLSTGILTSVLIANTTAPERQRPNFACHA